jgi:hypothetical protein
LYSDTAPTSQADPFAGIPDTPEVRQLKEAFYAETVRLAQSRGWTREAKGLLDQLGLQGPPEATIKATVTLQVTATVSDLFGEGTTPAQAREKLAGYSQEQIAREAARRADYTTALVTYEVNEPTAG